MSTYIFSQKGPGCDQNSLESPTSRSGESVTSGLFGDLIAEIQAFKKELDNATSTIQQLMRSNQRQHQVIHALCHQLQFRTAKYDLACDCLDVMADVCKKQGVQLASKIVELEADGKMTAEDWRRLRAATHIDDVAELKDELIYRGVIKPRPLKVIPATMVVGGGGWHKNPV